jgi:FixJ family two-component response regulator
MIESDPHIGAIITEQVMRSGDGVQLLETVRTLRPQVRRIVLTTYTDLAAIIHGLHSGAIQALVQKPIVDSELLAAVCPELAQMNSAPKRESA